MRDGIAFARRGLPSVALVTEPFWEQGDLVAAGSGMPGVPRLKLPYPIAGESEDVVRTMAEDHAQAVLNALRGE